MVGGITTKIAPAKTELSIYLPEAPNTVDNAELAMHWHDVARRCGQCVVEAAARAGEVLITQRDLCAKNGQKFKKWCDEHLPFNYRQAANYMKVANNWDRINAMRELPGEPPASIRQVLLRLRHEDSPYRVQRAAPSPTRKVHAVEQSANVEKQEEAEFAGKPDVIPLHVVKPVEQLEPSNNNGYAAEVHTFWSVDEAIENLTGVIEVCAIRWPRQHRERFVTHIRQLAGDADEFIDRLWGSEGKTAEVGT